MSTKVKTPKRAEQKSFVPVLTDEEKAAMECANYLEKPNLVYKEIFVTPKIAEEYLGLNVCNRVANDRNTNRYAYFMSIGEFPCAECLKFDADGHLIDGQHTLKAIVKLGVGRWCPILCGFGPKAIHVMDQGKSRSVGDSMHILGMPDSTTLASIVSNYVQLCSGISLLSRGGHSRVSSRTTNNEYCKIVDEDREYWNMVVSKSRAYYRALGIFMKGEVGGYIAFLNLEKGHPLDGPRGVLTFFDELTDAGLNKAIALLRQELVRQATYRKAKKNNKLLESGDRQSLFACAWNGFVAGKTVKSLQFKGKNIQFL